MTFDDSKYGFQGYSSQTQWGSAFSPSQVGPAPMDLPSLNRGKIERPKNVTMNFVPTTGTNNLGMTIKTEEVMIDGETHTNVTVQMPPEYERIMSRVRISVGDKCPKCKTGTMQGQFTKLGILLAIFCFPFGIAALFSTRNKVCDNCERAYDYEGNKIS